MDLNRLLQCFPAGRNYLIEISKPGLMDRCLTRLLMDPYLKNGRRFWKGEDEALVSLGRRIGWAPESVPPVWFSDSVERELGLAAAAGRGDVCADPSDIDVARDRLSGLGLLRIADQPPTTLSRGEEKTVRILGQWLKSPDVLFMDHFPSGLSIALRNRLLTLLEMGTPAPTLILGVTPSDREWSRAVLNRRRWIPMSDEFFREAK